MRPNTIRTYKGKVYVSVVVIPHNVNETHSGSVTARVVDGDEERYFPYKQWFDLPLAKFEE